MSETSSSLSQELSAISDGFSDLGERMLHAARQLHSPGAPPPQDLLDEMAGKSQAFHALRDRTRELAGSLHVTPSSGDSPDTIQSLTTLLDEVAEAEIRRDRGDTVRHRAVSILERVGALAHTGDPDFAPLRACQERAHALKGAIAVAPWHEPHGEAEQLAEGDHAFANLLTFIDNHDELDDEHWATLHESIAATFGKPLAVAAARSRLTVSQSDLKASENGQSSSHQPLGAPAGGS